MSSRAAEVETFFEDLVYRTVRGQGFTQNSPIMPDVWVAFGCRPFARQDLLLTPRWESTPEELAAGVRQTLGLQDPFERLLVELAHNRSVVAAKLEFEQVIELLPLSRWWRKYLVVHERAEGEDELDRPTERFLELAVASEEVRERLCRALQSGAWSPGKGPESRLQPTSHLLWLVRVLGTVMQLRATMKVEGHDTRTTLADVEGLGGLAAREVVSAFLDIASDVVAKGSGMDADTAPLWNVDRNRAAVGAMFKSTATVKADAARHLFEIQGRGITWAVADSGIDATHLAFRKRDARGKILEPAFEHRSVECELHRQGECVNPRHWRNNTRVKKTYEFRGLRQLRAFSRSAREYVAQWPREGPPRRGVHEEAHAKAHRVWRALCGYYPWLLDATDERNERLDSLLGSTQGTFEWSRWSPLLEVRHDLRYSMRHTPADCHGTHVAGILGADWRPEDAEDDSLHAAPDSPFEGARKGMCPEIELIDLRVIGFNEVQTEGDGDTELDSRVVDGDEFAVISALEFVRSENSRHAHMEIHGMNLSLSLRHDVSSYACGRTPVCTECEKLSADGVLVVVAAGNNGRVRYQTPNQGLDQGYRVASITDPGNAQSVITVGSTHRSSPQTYGVSYFSSRGPTGDGRRKPDLVAPGEKIVSTKPGNREVGLDGTSMAAPHVSGAAALLMCRYEELRGKPQEIKRILCDTATDLGREPYYQGAGLVDVLRALQSR